MNYMDMCGLTMAIGKAGFAAGTTTTVTIANNTSYCINGKAYTKTAASNAATPTTDLNTGAAFLGVKTNKASVFVFGLDSSGNIKAVQGEIVDLDSAGNAVVNPEWPNIPDTMCPFGYLTIKAGSTADGTTGWICGSANMASVTGITYAFVDILTLPNRPQIS